MSTAPFPGQAPSDRASHSGHSDLLSQAEALARIGFREVDLLSGEVRLSDGLYRLFGEEPGSSKATVEWLYERIPDDERLFVRTLSEGALDSEAFEFAHRILHADGRRRTVLHRAQVELDGAGTPRRLRTVLQDITAQRESEQALQDLANLDPATRLPNRQALLNQLQEAMVRAHRSQQRHALLVLEIDQLRLANETLGYAGGDALLREVALRLGTVDRQLAVDQMAHLGGGEFAALLCPDPATAAGPIEAAAQQAAHALTQALKGPVLIGGAELYLSCSIGVALFPANSDDAAGVLDCAQQAMRQAHEAGNDRMAFYSKQASSRATARIAFEVGLRHALERQEICLAYQPQIDLRTGRMVGVEAVSRWQPPGGEAIDAAQFFPVAAQLGLAIEMGEWVLNAACNDHVRWVAEGMPPLRVSVDMSPALMALPDLAPRIERVLKATGMNPRHLGIELTEGMLSRDALQVRHNLTALKAMGIQLVLDHFGTGQSNLGSLSKLPIDVVKIDRGFAPDVTAPTEDVSITRALIDLAHRLRMRVMADGVATDSQLALLVASHCDLVQGSCFSPAVAADGVLALLREERRLPQQLLTRHTRARTLLLVDDEENILHALRRLLRRDGYHLITATSGAEALQRLAEHTVDVIVSDQRMPNMTGVEFLRRAKELYPESVRLCLSGYTELQSITDAVNEGAIYRFLTKPWDDEHLRSQVAEAFLQKERADHHRSLDGQLRQANLDLLGANERLRVLSTRQTKLMARHDAYLLHTQELLAVIPTPLLGFDLDGILSFANDAAQALFDGKVLLGRHALEVLPAELRTLWHHSAQPAGPVQLGRQHYQVMCNELGQGTQHRGRLLCLTPTPTPAPAPPLSCELADPAQSTH